MRDPDEPLSPDERLALALLTEASRGDSEALDRAVAVAVADPVHAAKVMRGLLALAGVLGSVAAADRPAVLGLLAGRVGGDE